MRREKRWLVVTFSQYANTRRRGLPKLLSPHRVDLLAHQIRRRIREGTFRQLEPLLAARGLLGMVIYRCLTQELFGGNAAGNFVRGKLVDRGPTSRFKGWLGLTEMHARVTGERREHAEAGERRPSGNSPRRTRAGKQR
ncbi:MAG: hypothetical protein DMG22_01595 [Acidobacteria bacterium]|nr:MAG: hypothetical protein DMG22_01595 [Acidobacteriota bacterium]